MRSILAVLLFSSGLAAANSTVPTYPINNPDQGAATERTALLFKSESHADSTQLDSDLLNFASQNSSQLSTLDTDLLAFKTANHSDLVTVQGKQDAGPLGSSVVSFR